MKKIYILALAFGAFTLSTQAQEELYDDFESYTIGKLSAQAAHWRTWSGDTGSGEDADVTDDEANSGSKSMHISGNGQTDEILLIASMPTTGIYTIQWYGFIPSGKSGYFNMQAAKTVDGSAWNQALMGGNVYLNCDGSTGGTGGVTGVTDCSAFDVVFSYPENEWFKMTTIYDITNQSWSMYINDAEQFTGYPFAFGTRVFAELAGIDFFSASPNNDLYVDDVLIYKGVPTTGTNDVKANPFTIFPNPVGNIMNIKSATPVDKVAVYDILGRLVIQETPGKISPSINTSALPSGAYMVNVTIGSTTKTVKILK